MKLVLVDANNNRDVDKILDKLFRFIANDNFIVAFLLDIDVLKKQKIESSVKHTYECVELLDMRVIASHVNAELEQFVMVLTNIKTNRLMFQDANNVEDIRKILRLQIINKSYQYKEI